MVTGSTGRTRRRLPARRGEGAALRDEIIEAASRALAATGDANRLTLRGLAREVGVAATSIYLHFDNIEELLLAVKTARFVEFDAALAAAAEAVGADPYERVRARLHAYVDFAEKHPGEYTVMFAAALDGATEEAPAAHLSLHAIADDARIVLAATPAIRRPLPGGPADPAESLDAEALICAFQLWNGLHGMLALRRFRPNMPWPDLRAQVDDLIARILESDGPGR